MASSAQCKDFIAKVAPIMQKLAKERGYKICSTAIAQACIESAYGTSSLGYKYHNYFGMKCGSSWKGKSVNLSTKEEYQVGQITNIKANFRIYDSLEEGLAGYYDFISASRYANLKTATTYKQYAENLKADGYATSSTYVNTLTTTIVKWGLNKYDEGYTVKEVKSELYYPKYEGSVGSIVMALGYVGEKNTSLSNRKRIAKANNIANYTGTGVQNRAMLDLLKAGRLRRA